MFAKAALDVSATPGHKLLRRLATCRPNSVCCSCMTMSWVTDIGIEVGCMHSNDPAGIHIFVIAKVAIGTQMVVCEDSSNPKLT